MLQFSPLLPCTLALILGIVWQAIGSTPWLVFIFLAVAAAAFFARTYNYALLLMLTLCFFVTGALRYEQHKNKFELFFNNARNKCCKVKAIVDDIQPSYRPGITVLTLTIQDMQHKETVIAGAQGLQLKLSTQQPTDHLCAGDTVECPKIFLRACTAQDYKKYLIKEQLAGHVTSQKPIKLLKRPKYSLSRWLVQQRNTLLEKAQHKLTPMSFTLMASIFWGKKELDPAHMNPVKEQFKAWGILHYLARSGLHVLLFIMLWNWLLGWLPFPFIIKQMLLIIIIACYSLISWPSISFIRAIMLFLLYKICILSSWQINTLHLLALTTICVLLINPFQLFFLDFQLSFSLTFALAWLAALDRKK